MSYFEEASALEVKLVFNKKKLHATLGLWRGDDGHAVVGLQQHLGIYTDKDERFTNDDNDDYKKACVALGDEYCNKKPAVAVKEGIRPKGWKPAAADETAPPAAKTAAPTKKAPAAKKK